MPITPEERQHREDIIEESIATVRLEGLEPSEEAKAIFSRYVLGGLTIEEMSAEIRAMNARKFGPVHVSGD